MELVQVTTCTGPKFVHVANCAIPPVQVTSCRTKSQLVHNIYMYVSVIVLNFKCCYFLYLHIVLCVQIISK